VMNPFQWLAARVSASVVEGFTDGINRIESAQVEGLQARVADALAAPVRPAAALAAPAADVVEAPSKARGRKGGAS
jgi:hypothetical protein